jgi:dTDP-glucose pyrophosphorylase
MNDVLKQCISADASIASAAEILEQGAQKICLIINDNQLIGTITDGDIRRGILKGISFDAPAKEVMNKHPKTAHPTTDRNVLRTQMSELGLLHVPTIDDDGVLTGLISLDDLVHSTKTLENWVVLMAGGLGERLRPLTEKTPKPLLHIGEKPLLQSILETFIEQKFCNFYIAVNYRAEDIKSYFGDGAAWNVNIQYLEEEEPMGTAGALSLLPTPPTKPVIVMNGDLVTHTSFTDLLKFHDEQESCATMCVREYDFQVPFGVISIEDHRITAIDEKPLHRFFVNAGIYVLEPGVISALPKGQREDMTQVFERVIANRNETAVFPIHEYWLDIGRLDDLERAKSDFKAGYDN